MTLQINPGCAIPEIPGLPDVGALLTKLATDIAASIAASIAAFTAAALVPFGQAAKAALDLIDTIAEIAGDIADEVAFYVAQAAKLLARIEKLLTIPCPLLPRPDKAAISI